MINKFEFQTQIRVPQLNNREQNINVNYACVYIIYLVNRFLTIDVWHVGNKRNINCNVSARYNVISVQVN